MGEFRTPPRNDAAASRPAPPPAHLADDAIAWISTLPQHLRPSETASRFPRIANTLAARWKSPAQCRPYFEDLLLDQRGNRQGFPVRVALELAALKNHYDSVVYPTHQTVWDEIISRSRSA